MNQENEPYHRQNFVKGANSDQDPILLFSAEASGLYSDARNCRILTSDSNTGSANKIGGEILKFANSTGLSGYDCTGANLINGKVCSIWASTTPGNDGILVIDGVVVLRSVNFVIDPLHPFQLAKNQDVFGGQLFATDFNQPPFIFDIQDMIDSLITAPTKYFSAFDPELYQVNLQSPLDIPAFIELVNVGGGGGLPVGEYQYAIRYSNEAGDRTNWSQMTNPIPVMESLNHQSQIYPYVKTYAGKPDPQSKTAYATHIRFRITNLFNYDFIEVRRTALNQGAGIGFAPDPVIIARLDISAGEVSVRDFLDPAEQNVTEAISATSATQQIAFIKRAKAIRYYDKRTVLMNVEVQSKKSELTFETINGKEGFETIEALYTAGYNDPYNHTNKKSYPRGDRCGFAVNCYDGVGGKFFSQKFPTLTDFQFPNRRDAMGTDELLYSYAGTVRAADVNGVVNQTHEVFDLANGIAKNDVCSFKNIMRSGSIFGITGSKSLGTLQEDCDQTRAQLDAYGIKGTFALTAPYYPFTPVRQNDFDVSGHNYVVNTKVNSSGVLSPTEYDYRPKGFAPNIFAQGMLIAGVDNFPDGAKSFSIVRTPSPKKVITQGLGIYSLIAAEPTDLAYDKLTTKESKKLWFFSPDIENGIVSSDIVNDIIANPQNYQVQLVSPLGFFSEMYGFDNNELFSERDRLIDMISYARIIRDVQGPNSLINPGEDAGMGITDGGESYVGYGRWRNNTGGTPNSFNPCAGGAGGNKLFDLASVARISEGRGNYIELNFSEDIYGKINVGGVSENDFDNDGMKAWTEPVYMINIISKGAIVHDNDINGYLQTGHYQKLESIIGLGNGLANQNYILVDERWEDSIPHWNPTSPFATTPRYIYIKSVAGVEQKWVNATFLTSANIATIQAAITGTGSYTGPFGTNVQGMYRHKIVDANNQVVNDNQKRFFQIVFNVNAFFPAQNSQIIIKYDKTAPIRIFGGDMVIGESIFAPIDRESDADGKVAEKQFPFAIGFPYKLFKMNPRYYVVKDTGSTGNVIQDKLYGALGALRQLCFMFTVESRISTSLAFNANYPLQFFPLVNYIIRPNRWDETRNIVNNGIYQQYVNDYGEGEMAQWAWGGFRFNMQCNPDYSTLSPIEFFSKPAFGFTEKTLFPTRVMWSLPRAINSQSAPGLKTFPANNSFDISDDQGEIKLAYSATTDRGDNLYAFTNSGLCMLVTQKAILSDLNAGELGYMSADTFVKQQYWLNKKNGMTSEMWRSAAEGFASSLGQNGIELKQEAIFWANNESVWRLMNNQVMDISNYFYNKLFYGPSGVDTILPDYQTPVTAVYDNFYQEYWLCIGRRDEGRTFMFSQPNSIWYGHNDFIYDRFVPTFTKLYGLRDLEQWEMNQGWTANGQPVVFELIVGNAPQEFWTKEFIRWRINAPTDKPTRIEAYKEADGVLQTFTDQATNGQYYLKDYGKGWEQFVGRVDVSVDPTRPRFQGPIIFTKIIHNLPGPFKVVDMAAQFKLLK